MKIQKDIDDEIDKYIITSCVTFLAAFTVIFSIEKTSNNDNSIHFVSVVSIISIFSIFITLLLSLWHKYRSFLRREVYKRKHEQWLAESKNVLEEMIDSAYYSAENKVKAFLFENKNELEGKSKDEIDIILKNNVNSKDYLEANKNTIDAISYAMAKKRQECYESAFGKLNEKNAGIKLVIDKFAQGYRYYFFVIGLVSFLISLSLKFLN